MLVLADLVDVLEVAAPIIFMILYGVAQLVGSKQPQPGRPKAPRPRPPAEPRAAGPQASLEESLRREVEDFLRRAQGQQPAERQRSRKPRAAEAPSAKRSRPAEPPPARRPTELRPMPEPTAVSTPGTQAPLGSGVSQHVAQHLGGAAEIVARAQRLGSEVAHADERMQQHLQEKFAHTVGTLAPRSSAPEKEKRAPTTPAAQELVKMLTRPGGAAQVIVAAEILRRPEERWW